MDFSPERAAYLVMKIAAGLVNDIQVVY